MNQYFPGPTQATGRPWDFVSGWESAQQAHDMRPAQQYALEQMMLANQGKRQENDRYRQETPHYIAKLPYLTDQARGLADQERAKGNAAQATWQSGADATNMSNFNQGFENTLRALELTASTSPMYADAEYQKQRMNWPESIRNSMPRHWEPGLADRARNLTLNTPKHRQDVAVKNVEGGHAYDRQRMASDTAIEVARIAANARVESGSIKQAREKLENMLVRLYEKEITGQATPQDIKHRQNVEKMLYQLRAASQSQSIDPNMLMWLIMQNQMGGGQRPPVKGAPEPVAPVSPPGPAAPQSGPARDPNAPLGSAANPIPLK